MNKYFVIALFLVAAGLRAFPQKIITIGQCYEMASGKSSLSGEKQLYVSISEMKDRNMARSRLPSLDAGAAFLYNSEVIDLGGQFEAVPVPGLADALTPLPREQYKVTLDITQNFFDGGAVKEARNMESKALQVNLKQNETDLYRIRAQVNNCYFPVLLIVKQEESLLSFMELIDKRISAVESALRNGAALASDIDVLKAERLNITRQLKEAAIKKESLLKILSDLTGTEILPEDRLTVPSFGQSLNEEPSRPELQYFDLRKEYLAAGIRLAETGLMPKAFGFATVGYGNPPGNNFLKDEFASYYIIGAGVKWNIFDWNRVKTEKEILSLEQALLDRRKRDLQESLNRMLEAKKAEIASLEYMIESDLEIIELRKRISAAAQSRYENGTITMSDLLNELNAGRQAEVARELNKINLAQAKTEYHNISGQEIK